MKPESAVSQQTDVGNSSERLGLPKSVACPGACWDLTLRTKTRSRLGVLTQASKNRSYKTFKSKRREWRHLAVVEDKSGGLRVNRGEGIAAKGSSPERLRKLCWSLAPTSWQGVRPCAPRTNLEESASMTPRGRKHTL